MSKTPKTVQQYWADRCGIDWNDERAIEPHLYGWPDKYALFRDGWDSACLEAQAWLKDGETIAQALQRKHDDTTVVLEQLVAEKKRNEQLEAELATLQRQVEEKEADIKALKGFADLWYFVMDEVPGAFETIVVNCPPDRWMSEAAKLRNKS